MAASNSKRASVGAIEVPDNADGETLKAQAERCRRLARATYNREVAESLGAMAEDYEHFAERLSKKRDR